MSTRSYIGIPEDGKFRVVYCHSDGYLDGVGLGLVEYYTTLSRVKNLMKKGDMSFLDKDPKEILYYKDRGETDTDSTVLSKDVLIDHARMDIDFVYIFNSGKWYYMNERTGFKLIKVEDTKEYKDKFGDKKENIRENQKQKIVELNGLFTKLIGNQNNVQLFTSMQDKRDFEFNKYVVEFRYELEGKEITKIGQFNIGDKVGESYGEVYKEHIFLVLVSRTLKSDNMSVEIIKKQGNFVEVIELNSKGINSRKLKRFPKGTKELVNKLLGKTD